MYKNILKIKPLHYRQLKRVTKRELKRSTSHNDVHYKDVYFIVDGDGDYEVRKKDDGWLLFCIWNHNI